MIYSVFDWNAGQYAYFDGPGEKLGVRPAPRVVLNDAGGRGHKLEDVLPTVPAGAAPAGTGTTPKGRIAVLGTALRAQYGDQAADRGGYGEAAGGDFTGFGDDGEASSGLPSGNPLVDSPWLTLGLWAGAVLLGYKVANWLGKRVAGV